MRSIKNIHKANYAPIGTLITYTALPTHTVQQIDPFLFLNHHGPQHYSAENPGLPFGPHPHRGMETVTFILDGDIMHKDTEGHESIITAGGVQWMTAGKGLIHAEISSPAFKKKGGDLEILQLWLNLPARLKMINPRYIGLQKKDLPVVEYQNGKVWVTVVSGQWEQVAGAFESHTKISLTIIHCSDGGQLSVKIPVEHNVFFYVISGKINVNDIAVEAFHLVEFENDDEGVHIVAVEGSRILLGHARPLNEPVVAQGPFVMNTEEEIHQAYADYNEGRFGQWSMKEA